MKEDFIHDDLFYSLSSKKDGNLSCKWGLEDEVIHNRKKFLEGHNLTLSNCIMADLNQGNGVAIVGKGDLGRAMKKCGEVGIEADALITRQQGIYLFLLVADCMPMVLYDPIKKVLALVHLGRLTTNLRLVQKTIRKMMEVWGVNPVDVLAHGGPSIKQDSYGLDTFRESEDGWHDFVKKGEDGKFWVDVVGYNRKQLLDMKVKEDNIYISSIDTFTSDEYFSHYRSVRTGEDEGRFATVVGMK